MFNKLFTLMLTALILTAPAYGQLFGLPIGASASEGQRGDMTASGGLIAGEHFSIASGRYSMRVLDEAFVFGDLGIVFPDHGRAGAGFLLGGQHTLPMIDELPVDIAPRITLGYARYKYEYRNFSQSLNVWMLTAGAVVSYQWDDLLTPYAFIGMNQAIYSHRRYNGGKSEWDPAIAAGVLFHFMPDLSAYAEAMLVSDAWLGIGIRHKL
jgi:hypothetical protein